MAGANVYFEEPDFRLGDGVSLAQAAEHAGAELLGATAYELQPGSRRADLHVHHANEELIVVLSGPPTPHTLCGPREPATREVVACRRGRQGAHRLSNDAGEAEPPWSEAPYDEAKGRLIRVFDREQGKPVPPDA